MFWIAILLQVCFWAPPPANHSDAIRFAIIQAIAWIFGLFCVLFGGGKHPKIVERSVIVALIGLVTFGMAEANLHRSDKQLGAILEQFQEEHKGDDPYGGA
jgi:hypothetical protein